MKLILSCQGSLVSWRKYLYNLRNSIIPNLVTIPRYLNVRTYYMYLCNYVYCRCCTHANSINYRCFLFQGFVYNSNYFIKLLYFEFWKKILFNCLYIKNLKTNSVVRVGSIGTYQLIVSTIGIIIQLFLWILLQFVFA